MQLILKNFRAVQEARVDLAPVTLVYGPNGTGKSTLLYAPVVLRNIVMNPAQGIPAFFNLRVVNLGGLREVVFDHDTHRELELGLLYDTEFHVTEYRVALWGETSGRFSISVAPASEQILGGQRALEETSGRFSISVAPVFMNKSSTLLTEELEVSFPYSLGQRKELTVQVGGEAPVVLSVGGGAPVVLSWDGITFTAISAPAGFEAEARELVLDLNSPVEWLRRVSLIPLTRGFLKPHYSRVPIISAPLGEDEVATWIAADEYFEDRISSYLEKIVGRQFHVRARLGTEIFSLMTRDPQAALGVELVNDGFGINQLVYLLAKSLHRDSALICIEEPEIHLHPGAIRRLARVLGEIALKEGKTFLISTHSEALVTAFLAEVAAGRMEPGDLACYASLREGKAVRFERRAVNEWGQVDGGLESFMEGEEEVTKALLGVADEASDDSGAGRVDHP